MVLLVASVPLILGYPSTATLDLGKSECLLLSCVVMSQFVGQLLLNRGFQRVSHVKFIHMVTCLPDITHLLMTSPTQQSATRGSAINVLQVLFSYVWDIVVLRSTAHLLSMAGAAMVVLGVLCTTLQKNEARGDRDPDTTALLRGGQDPSLGNDKIDDHRHTRHELAIPKS